MSKRASSFPWSPLHGGLRGGVLRKEAAGVRGDGRGKALEAMETHGDQIQRYEDLADELGHQPGDVGLA